MSSLVRVILAAVLLVIATTATLADGSRRSWRVYHGIGAISRNVITPWFTAIIPLITAISRPIPCRGCKPSSWTTAGTGASVTGIGRVGSRAGLILASS
jgi:hypothetical protein